MQAGLAGLCILASLLSYRGTVVLPHDPTTGMVGICPTNGVVYESTTIRMADPPELEPGQIVRLSEDVQVDGRRIDRFITDLEIVGHGRPPAFMPVSGETLNGGKALGRLVSFKGTVQDVFRDDIDDRYVFAAISDGRNTVLWAGACKVDDARLKDLIGARVEATGVARSGNYPARRNSVPTIDSTSLKSLVVLSRPTTSLFDAPDIAVLENSPPSEIAFKPRHRASGRVLSVLDQSTFLIRRTNDTFATVHSAFAPAPECGDFIEAVGFPESDLYTINLTRAVWRKPETPPPPSPAALPPVECTIEKFLPDVDGVTFPCARLHGRLLKVCGVVRRLPLPGEPAKTALIESNGYFLEINPGLAKRAFDRLEVGSTVAVTGIAFVEKEHWRPHFRIPRVVHTSLVLRTPEDVEVLSDPPFWTPVKFMALIAVLLVSVVAALLRNRAIRRLSEERVKERTRLAAELHDTIAQNLTGAAIQLETAEALAANSSDRLRHILASAVKIMHVSREELRNCIWDLRNRTLDEKRVEDALRRTLMPHLCGTRLKLRFPVERADISDRSAHAAVGIVRELVANAIHHGHPSLVSIAGTLEGDKLVFSVSDDGCGFDAERAPGPRDGHFGLIGIRERVRKLNGSFNIRSRPGAGTKATIELPR